MTSRRSFANLVGLTIGVAGLVFVGVRIARDWDQLTATLESAQLPWLVAAVAAGLTSMTLIGVNWLALIRRRGHAAPLGLGLSWFFTGQLGKYVPGGVWPVVGQAELAGRGGADRRSAYLATASSMTFTLLGAVTVAVVSGLLSPNDRALTAFLLGLGMLVVLGSLASPSLRSKLGRLASSATRGRAELPAASVVARYTLRHVPVWLMFGIMNVCVLLGLGGDLGPGLFVDMLYASSLSWIVGFVVVGVPGGIGVRESVFVGLMTGPLGATLALSVAVAGRLVTVAVDLLGALGAAVIARSRRSRAPSSVRSLVDVPTAEADHPDPVLQRGGDTAADGGRPSA